MEAPDIMHRPWCWPIQDCIDFELICMDTISGNHKNKKHDYNGKEGAFLAINIEVFYP